MVMQHFESVFSIREESMADESTKEKANSAYTGGCSWGDVWWFHS